MTFSKDKRAIVSITTFIVLVSALLSLVMLSFYLYQNASEEAVSINQEKQLYNSLSDFREAIIQLNSNPNSTLEYRWVDGFNAKIEARDHKLYAQKEFTEVEISMLGLHFCRDYNFTTYSEAEFVVDEGCITMISSS